MERKKKTLCSAPQARYMSLYIILKLVGLTLNIKRFYKDAVQIILSKTPVVVLFKSILTSPSGVWIICNITILTQNCSYELHLAVMGFYRPSWFKLQVCMQDNVTYCTLTWRIMWSFTRKWPGMWFACLLLTNKRPCHCRFTLVK